MWTIFNDHFLNRSHLSYNSSYDLLLLYMYFATEIRSIFLFIFHNFECYRYVRLCPLVLMTQDICPQVTLGPGTFWRNVLGHLKDMAWPCHMSSNVSSNFQTAQDRPLPTNLAIMQKYIWDLHHSTKIFIAITISCISRNGKHFFWKESHK